MTQTILRAAGYHVIMRDKDVYAYAPVSRVCLWAKRTPDFWESDDVHRWERIILPEENWLAALVVECDCGYHGCEDCGGPVGMWMVMTRDTCDLCHVGKVPRWDTRLCPFPGCDWNVKVCRSCFRHTSDRAVVHHHVLGCAVALGSGYRYDPTTDRLREVGRHITEN